MEQCHIQSKDGKRCPNEVEHVGDVACAHCCRVLEELLQQEWEQRLARHANN
jgi:hypothetical protein